MTQANCALVEYGMLLSHDNLCKKYLEASNLAGGEALYRIWPERFRYNYHVKAGFYSSLLWLLFIPL